MLPGSTLFFDVAVQRDCFPGGPWPLVTSEQAENVLALFRLAARFGIRQGGIVCMHADGEGAPSAGALAVHAAPAAGAPPHCRVGVEGVGRPPDCEPARPSRYWTLDTASAEVAALDRTHADYVGSGCGLPPDASATLARVVDHVTAGVRDAVVFGAGIEHAITLGVDALLRRRIRTHVAIDAAGTAAAEEAQRVIASWKRRMVDVTTTAMVARLLGRGA
jgi:hypothetical protein